MRVVFIDNDHKERAKEDCRHATQALYFGLEDEPDVTPEIISDFRHLDREEKGKLIYDPEIIILTYSMYTWNHYNSLGQLYYFLVSCAKNEIKGKLYINTSSYTVRAIEDILRSDKYENQYAVLCTLATNYIITTIDSDTDMGFYRLVPDLKGYWDDPLKLEPMPKWSDILSLKTSK